MQTTAAILIELGRPLEIVDLEIPTLKAGQVLVDIHSSGVCHTQLLEARGYRGRDPFLPHCLGHEAAGVVLEIGADVSKVQPGQRVIGSWMKGSGADIPGSQYTWQSRTVNAGGITTFQRQAVVSENRLTRLPAGIDDGIAALLGCAVPTGAGAVRNTARVTPGQSLAVFGTGGVGLCAVAAAAAAEANPIIAVDVHPSRLALARQLGATDVVNAVTTDALADVRERVPAGVDVAIEASGRPDVMRQALRSVRSRGGCVVIIGNARQGEVLEIDPAELNQGKRLLGTWGGDNEPDRDFPRYCQQIIEGQLILEPLISESYPLSRINDALADLESGRVPRPIVDMRL